MKKNITKNYVYNLLYQIFALLFPLVTAPYISRTLGAENVGIYSYTLSITSYFILFGSLGISLYGQREIAYVQDSKEKYSKLFWEILFLKMFTMSISLIVFYFLFVNGTQYNIYYKILLFELIADCLDISWFFQGMEEFKKTITRNIIIKIISIVCIFIFVKQPDDLVIYVLIYVLSSLIGNLSLWTYLPKYLTKVSNIHIFAHLKSTLSLFIPQIAVNIYTVLDKVMIGAIIIDKSQVGFYDQSQKIIKMLLTIVTSLGIVMLPRISNIYSKGEHKKLEYYIYKSFNLVYMISFPMIFGIIAVSKYFVPIFFGNGYEQVSLLMKTISPILLFIGMSNVIGKQYLLPTKKQKEFTMSVIFGAITNFLLNLILIPKYGAFGASISTVIAELIVTLIQLYYVRRVFDIKQILKIQLNYVIASLIMLIACLLIALLNINYVIILLIQLVVGVIVYFSYLYLTRDKLLLLFLDKIKLKVRCSK